jgi:hypothetical protein
MEISPELQSHPLDVQIGPIRTLAGGRNSNLTLPTFAIEPGSGVQHPAGNVGTLGGFVTTGNDVMMLGNNHILAAFNKAQTGDDIYHPTAPAGAVVGKFDWCEPLRTTGNRVDLALAQVTWPRYEAKIPAIGKIAGASSFDPDWVKKRLKVRKFGNASQLTHGYVTAVFAILVTDVDGTACVFDDAVEVLGTNRSFSDPGDSGSLVMDPTNKAVGVLFAGSASHSYFFSMSALFGAKPGLTLVT